MPPGCLNISKKTSLIQANVVNENIASGPKAPTQVAFKESPCTICDKEILYKKTKLTSQITKTGKTDIRSFHFLLITIIVTAVRPKAVRMKIQALDIQIINPPDKPRSNIFFNPKPDLLTWIKRKTNIS